MSIKTRFVSRKTFNEIAQDNALESENVALRKSYIISKLDESSSTDEKPALKFSITTQDIDRDGDTVSLGGWDFTDFANNPVVLWAHDYSKPPVGKASTIFRDANSIDSTAEFTPKSISEFGFMIYQMYKGGFLNAVSVGFQPTEFETARDRDAGLNFLKQSLMEYSAVPVPSNPQALIQARSFGINTMPMKSWAENILDDWDKSGEGVLMPKKAIELIRIDCDEKKAVSVAVKNAMKVLESTGAEKEKQNIQKTGVDVNRNTENEYWKNIIKLMGDLLGGSETSIDYDKRRSMFSEIAEQYKRHGKTEMPDYRFVEAQVLRNMPDAYYLDSESGLIEQLTDDIKIERETKTVIEILENCTKNAQTEHVKSAAIEALNAFKDYKNLSCCEKNSSKKNSDDQKINGESPYIELEIEDDGIEKNVIFDESVTLDGIAEIIQLAVDEAMRKRSGRLD